MSAVYVILRPLYRAEINLCYLAAQLRTGEFYWSLFAFANGRPITDSQILPIVLCMFAFY